MPRPSVSLSLRLFLTWAGCAAPPRVSSTVPNSPPRIRRSARSATAPEIGRPVPSRVGIPFHRGLGPGQIAEAAVRRSGGDPFKGLRRLAVRSTCAYPIGTFCADDEAEKVTEGFLTGPARTRIFRHRRP